MVRDLSSNFELSHKQTSKSIKEKVVRNTNNLELEVIEVKDHRPNLFTHPKLLE